MKLQRPTAFFALAALLSGCESVPPPTNYSAHFSAQASPAGVRAFEKAQREKAFALERQGHWRDAATAWELLTLIDPDAYENRLAAAQKKIDAEVETTLERARQEAKKADASSAEPFYLATLALQPHNKEAADGLRAIERARNRREFLLKPSRTMPLPGEAFAQRPVLAMTSGNSVSMEQASNLARQGDAEEATDLVEAQLKATPNDPAVRDLLAELLFKKAQSLQVKQAAGAQASLKRCLQLVPKHAGCQRLLTQLTPRRTDTKPPASRL